MNFATEENLRKYGPIDETSPFTWITPQEEKYETMSNRISQLLLSIHENVEGLFEQRQSDQYMGMRSRLKILESEVPKLNRLLKKFNKLEIELNK